MDGWAVSVGGLGVAAVVFNHLRNHVPPCPSPPPPPGPGPEPRAPAPGPAAIHVVYRDSVQRRDRTLPYPQGRRLQGAGEGGGAIVPTGEKRLGHRPALCLTKRCGNFYSVAPGRNGFACGFVCVSVEHMRTWNYQDYRRVYHARGSGESLRCTVALLKHILNLFPNALKHA